MPRDDRRRVERRNSTSWCPRPGSTGTGGRRLLQLQEQDQPSGSQAIYAGTVHTAQGSTHMNTPSSMCRTFVGAAGTTSLEMKRLLYTGCATPPLTTGTCTSAEVCGDRCARHHATNANPDLHHYPLWHLFLQATEAVHKTCSLPACVKSGRRRQYCGVAQCRHVRDASSRVAGHAGTGGDCSGAQDNRQITAETLLGNGGGTHRQSAGGGAQCHVRKSCAAFRFMVALNMLFVRVGVARHGSSSPHTALSR